ncbi:putative ABC transporter ATP-binding protein [Nymphon striatum]|nr:putative ABC transporter ATP-binding protein [Nymphon striatum]
MTWTRKLSGLKLKQQRMKYGRVRDAFGRAGAVQVEQVRYPDAYDVTRYRFCVFALTAFMSVVVAAIEISLIYYMGRIVLWPKGMETIAQPIALVDKSDAKPLDLTQGQIELRDLTHHYGREQGGLQGLNLVVQPGERIGLIGRSGAGKSTLVKLLLRFYDAEGGQILIDDQDLTDVTQDSLRRHIGMVQQDSSLLHRSVRDNILYGRPEASEAEMIAAAKQAQAHEFILDLSDPEGRSGYDARVGERGVKLSGGQRQRITLARRPSALDSEVEAVIQETLYGMMAGKTVIAIAHRLSTIAEMDRIIVLDAGRIVEEGTHNALLAAGRNRRVKISDWINPFAAADGPPPQTLAAFMRWSLAGAWAVLFLAALLSAFAGALEAGTAWILGRVIDAAISAGPETFFDGRNIGLIMGAIAFFLIARPVLFGLSSGANAIIVGPNVNPLVLSRLHRWTLGQNVGFFDDDFAGRIAQKQMQTSRAVTDVAVEMINVVAFALASLFGSVALLVAIDWRVAVGFAAWLIGYFALINWFLPRVRKRSAARAWCQGDGLGAGSMMQQMHRTLEVTQGEIELRQLSFAYGRQTGGIEDINLTIAPGEKLGIVGASGAGKSTLVALLLRLYEGEKGAILIDGADIRGVTQEKAHEFIQDLQDHKGRQGYDAHLGERGVKLSGGQRQRIALARAILKDAPILILDEATSALDSEVEASIQTALTRVMEGKTVLAIAHRLSTLTEMDRIIVMDAGRIVESGTHQALLAQDGLYARYWQRQSGGFLNVKAAE